SPRRLGKFKADGGRSEIELQMTGKDAWGGVLDGNLFAFLSDLVAIVGDVGEVHFQRRAPGFFLPKVETGGDIGGGVPEKAHGAVEGGGASAVAQVHAAEPVAPFIAIEKAGGAAMGFVEGRQKFLPRSDVFPHRVAAGN